MKTRYMIALAAGALALVGCQRENPTDEFGLGDGQIRYSISNVGVKSSADDMSSTGSLSLVSRDGKMTVPATCEVSEGIDLGCGSAETKGALINTSLLDETLPAGLGFTVSAYKGSTPQFEDKTATKSGDYWTMDPPQYWPLSTKLTFYAYTNAGGNTVSQTATSQTLTYTVKEDAAAHKDLMLGYYKGEGGNKGIAEMRFDHPLTAVRFKKGLMEDVKGIRSITISRLASGGTVTMDAYGDIGNWTVADTDEYKTKVILSDGEDFLEVDETTKFIGKDSDGNYDGAFLLIPQTLSDHGVTVTVVLAMDYGYDMTVIADITSGAWQAGKTYTYTLGYIVEDPNLLPGMFSVSPTEYVRFSKGNLFCVRSGSEGSYIYEFGLESNQYDFRTRPGNYAVKKGVIMATGTGSDESGLFQYDLSSAVEGGDYGAFSMKNPLPGDASKILDFGKTIGTKLYTMTKSEWDYLLSKHTYVWCKVNGIYGCAFAPHDYDIATQPWTTTGNELSNWEEAEYAGVLFIPAAGFMQGEGVNFGGIYVDGIEVPFSGYSWTSTVFDSSSAYYLGFGESEIGNFVHVNGYAFPVRLARKFKKQ